jgi:hypothetical protein
VRIVRGRDERVHCGLRGVVVCVEGGEGRTAGGGELWMRKGVFVRAGSCAEKTHVREGAEG